jgi:hypothetical protein
MKTDNQGNGVTLDTLMSDLGEMAKSNDPNTIKKFFADLGSISALGGSAGIAKLSSALSDDLMTTNNLTVVQAISVAIGCAVDLSQKSPAGRAVALVGLQTSLTKLLDQSADESGVDRKVLRAFAASQIASGE